MTLADELRGVATRRPLRGTRRLHFCVGVASAADVWREERLQRARAGAARWRKKHPVRAKTNPKSAREKERKRQWRLNNLAYVRRYQAQAMREWRRRNPERRKELHRSWYEKNRIEINARRREKHARNREQINARRREQARLAREGRQ